MTPAPKVVLVTGCSQGGIGYSLCEAYAVRGCIVYATAHKLESMDGFAATNIHVLKLDVTEDRDVEDAVKTIIEREGRNRYIGKQRWLSCTRTPFST
ncbi:hypothetical protein QCA50_010317 [Cerrena zonata]|uniref:Uncharacterized protein n=1 Tax=Cerrena zonata TaxID=2478898 RepID=A0AAW0G5B3_9APHY